MGDQRLDQHIAGLAAHQQEPLLHIRALLAELLPAADETMKYNMPCLAVRGKGIAAFDAFKHHWSYFPMSGSVLEAVSGLPGWVDADKGTLRVPLDRRLTKAIVSKLVRVRLHQISDVANGKRFEFYPDASVKAEGSTRAGQPVGLWTTYDRSGNVTSQTRR